MGIDLNRFKGGRRSQDWLDWLSDDPIPESIRNRLRHKAPEDLRPQKPAQMSPTAKKAEPGAPTVSINISLPSIKKIKLPQQLPKGLTYKKLGIGGAALVGVIIVGAVVVHFHNTHKKGNTGVLSAVSQTPQFKVVVPDGQSPEQRYDVQRKVVSYKDSVGGVEVTVSEQALPEGLKDNTDDKVKKLAQGFSANEVIETSTPTAYLGTSVKGPQTVIFSKNGLLIFIQSANNIDKTDWATYITQLK